MVGLTGVVESVMLGRRLFFADALRSLGELDRRLALAAAGPDATVGTLRCLGELVDGFDAGY